MSSFAFLKMTFPIGYFYVVQRPNDEFASQFHRNLCIDGGYEICAEMYNKNILAPLSTFVPKVCLCDFTRAPKPHCPNDLSVYSYWAVQLTLGGFFFRLLDFIDFGAIYRLTQNGARECTEGGIRIRRKCHYHFVVSLVSRPSRVQPMRGLLLPPTPRVA